MQIIGQEKLLNIVNTFLDSSNLPQSILFIGDKGCGKHTIASYIASSLNLELQDISQKISDEYISDIYLSVTRYIYLLDFSCISFKNQNSLLKFIEEPPKNCYIIGICENKTQVLPTIQNRCSVLYFDRYTKQQLNLLTDDEYLLSVCNTPGKIITFQNMPGIDIEKYKSLAKTIVEKIYNANIANILTISNKLSFKDTDASETLSVDLFLVMLKKEIESRIIYDTSLSNQYYLVEKLYNDFMIPHVNKKYLFENFLIRLKYSR